jgi:hypothetical protein
MGVAFVIFGSIVVGVVGLILGNLFWSVHQGFNWMIRTLRDEDALEQFWSSYIAPAGGIVAALRKQELEYRQRMSDWKWEPVPANMYAATIEGEFLAFTKVRRFFGGVAVALLIGLALLSWVTSFWILAAFVGGFFLTVKQKISPPQQNLWASFGSGRPPSW